MTLTQLVNEVLKQLREDEVTNYNNTPYSKLIARFVNIAKRQVENAWNWIALRSNVTASFTGSANQTLTGTNQYSRILRAYNTTKRCWVTPISWEKAVDYNNKDTVETGDSIYYRVVSRSSGALVVEVFPKPSGTQTIVFETVNPTSYLTDDVTTTLAPDELIIHAAYALAVLERGDDGGLGAQAADGLYNAALGDAISIEESLLQDEVTWRPVN